MRKKYLCILICLFANALAFASAANRTITGVVISGEDNEPSLMKKVVEHSGYNLLILKIRRESFSYIICFRGFYSFMALSSFTLGLPDHIFFPVHSS